MEELTNRGGGFVLVRCVGISALLLFTLSPILACRIGMPLKFFIYFVQNNNLLLLIVAGWFVYEADVHRFSRKWINSLAQSILAIYIISDSSTIRRPLTEALLPEVMRGHGFVYIFLICIGCILIDRVRIALFKYVSWLLHILTKHNLKTTDK